MDAVELPLPAAVVVSKLLGSEAFGRSGSPRLETRSRVLPPVVGLLYFLRRGLLPAHRENGPKKIIGEDNCPSWPKYDSGEPHKKSLKRRSSPIQARTSHPGVSVDACGVKDAASGNNGSLFLIFLPFDKFRAVKNKRCQESRKRDRKTLRTTVKTKFDSKDSLVNSHSTVNGNRGFGTLGVKFDHLDLTKSVDDLSLNELLDGSFSCPPNSYQERAKKASSANENILLSIRKAASVLTAHNTMGSSGSWKAPGTLDSTNSEREDKYAEATAFLPLHQANVNDSPAYQPKDILQRLGLSAARDLGSILADSDVGRGALPAFPWSISHTGPSKPIVDASKSTMSRSSSQGKWVRIGSNSCLMGEERSSFPELDLKIGDHTQDSIPKRGASGFLSSSPFSLMAGNMGSSDSAVLLTSADAVGRSYGSIRIREATEPPARDAQNHSGRNHWRQFKSPGGVSDRCPSRSSPSLEGSSSGELLLYRYSPRLLAAAEILCEVASGGRGSRHAAGRVTWPIAPSQKTMKARKVNPCVAKPDPPRATPAKAGDPVKFCAATRVGDEKKRTIYRPPPLLKCSIPAENAHNPLRPGGTRRSTLGWWFRWVPRRRPGRRRRRGWRGATTGGGGTAVRRRRRRQVLAKAGGRKDRQALDGEGV
ncbi:unnamed protein product [Spirodela intermedia]|uniref:Uncharacterized protein n=1 Tax=Spirodela intermedia TaxID=51605 RepID=A0A7I8JN54_SPIIN|nr:unnamed protein product [Spirodela intermedia]CAA6671594.1 unnamed protein product [Spirodela intermedia]